ncbi:MULTISPECIES: sigma 54-interacting transcriptional regulator [Sphingobacterium]|uniref:Sigma 54-interacting transcriptional regulator n=1 Tax=Sphingobacterium thalpophilum TaxID=259 RepID=A0ACD5C5A7_9SPHI|nr:MULTISPECIES: sigma 54-interacting transcriptional regulator [Sphingobacterium]OFV11039.1 magnesium chelatase [Sphingobacterium sp. HMSC13C05]OJZ07438.1 MAG: magnesium chelatase [Sphingobacterium sp. 40-24]
MDYTKITTFGALKTSGYKPKTIKEELRQNLITKIKTGETVFNGVHGYEDTVIPELERAILSKHNINFLGLRGQAKTRLARLMVNLLDEYVPVVQGSEINDDPFNPISRYAIELLKEKGDDTPISWLGRGDRFAEKLATPDVTVADLIGDVDPIKAANLKLSYADDRVIHFGMIPRANRSIFVINELPDLQARIQVALFNILQEGDIQIRGFKLRLPLDVQFIFTANPEDYTNRGSIVTPLKDRIGSQILTHYPASVEIAKAITAQEANLEAAQKEQIYVPELARELIEQISFEARNSEYVDEKSGVSARMSITAFQNLLSTAELRMLRSGEQATAVRLSDFMGIVPAITGKVELVYEGEQEGAGVVAVQLIENAIKSLFPILFPKIEKLERENERYPYDDIVRWFSESEGIELSDELNDLAYGQVLDQVKPIHALIQQYQPETKPEDLHFLTEFVLWGLTLNNKLSKYRLGSGLQFQDNFQGYLRNNL